MEMDALTRIAKRNPSIDPTAIDRSQQAAKHVAAVGLKLGSYWLEPALGGKPVPGAGRLFECDSSVRDVGPCGPSQHCGVPRSAPGHADNRAPGTTKSDGLCPRRASSIVSDPRGGQPRMAMKVELTSPMPLSRRGFLPGGRHGLGDPSRARVAPVEHDGRGVLRGRPGLTRWAGGPRRFSTRIGRPVHQRGVRGPGAGGGRGVLDGRPGPLPRQHLHREAVAVAEVRGGVPARTPATGWTPSGSSARGSTSTTRCARIRCWAGERQDDERIDPGVGLLRLAEDLPRFVAW